MAHDVTPPCGLSGAEWSAVAASLNLSRREQQVIARILMCENEGEIAAALSLSAHTVHSYAARLYRKIGARSKADAVSCVLRAYVTHVRKLESDRHP